MTMPAGSFIYAGNKHGHNGTASLKLASGPLALGATGMFTAAEFNALQNDYFLDVPGSFGVTVVAGPPTVQTITIYNWAGAGFQLTFNGQTTAKLASGATPTQVQAALVALSTIGAGGCTVTGPHGGPYVVTFTGSKASAAQPMITVTGADAVTVADLSQFNYVYG